jgi:hypothetical protein
MMKKLLIAVFMVLTFVTLSFGASSQVVTKPDCGVDCRSIKVAFLAENAVWTAYAFTAEENAYIKGWWLCQIITNPGAEPPDALWDLTLYTSDGTTADILGGAGLNRHTTNSEVIYPMVDSTTYQRACVPVTDNLTMALSGLDVGNTKEVDGTVWFFFYRYAR